MLSAQDLSTLYRDHRGEHVLSVYLDASQTDPAHRSAWHTRFENKIRDTRRELEERGEDLGPFDAAVKIVRTSLGDPEGFLQGRGWVGFATKETALYAEGVPVPMPNLVRWEAGIRVAPYLRALKQARPIGVAIVDSRRARLFRFQDGDLEEFMDLRADRDSGDFRDTLGSKRAETTTGVRGATGKDRAQIAKNVEASRMLDRVAAELAEVPGDSGTIVLGGVDTVANQLQKLLPVQLQNRVALRPRLSFDLSDSEIRAEVEAAASSQSLARQADLLGEVFDTALSGGAACLGRVETERAIRDRRVRSLFVSDAFRRSEPDVADWLVGGAFEGSASAIEVSGDAASRLDTEAEGVAALLHYRGDAPADGSDAHV